MARGNSGNVQEEVSRFIAKINAQNPFVIVWILIGVILIFFYLLFFQAKFKETTALSAEIRNLRQTLDETKNNLQRLDQYNHELLKFRKKAEVLNKKIKSKEEIPAALENLSRLASENGVKIEQMMPDEARSQVVLENTEGHFMAIPVIIGARSSYHDFGRFINKLEDAGIFLGIADFGIMTNTADSNQHLVKVVLNLVIFEKAEKTDKPARIPGKRIQ